MHSTESTSPESNSSIGLKSPGGLPLRADLKAQADSATRKDICNLGSSPSTLDQSSHSAIRKYVCHLNSSAPSTPDHPSRPQTSTWTQNESDEQSSAY